MVEVPALTVKANEPFSICNEEFVVGVPTKVITLDPKFVDLFPVAEEPGFPNFPQVIETLLVFNVPA